jgi:hypothetical protein
MKTALTLEEINQVIDSIESHAKVVCDRTYEKATESVGKNDHFKELIDDLFEKISKSQIKLMKTEMSILFSTLEPGSSLTLESIKEYTSKCIEQQTQKMSPSVYGGRFNGKSAIVATYTIVSACRTAFVEKLAEYLGVEV